MKSLFFICMLSVTMIHSLRANNDPVPVENPGPVTGSVFDSISNQPVEYANVVVYSLPDSLQVGGSVTDASGTFRISGLKSGRYYAQIQFFGYKKINTLPFEINAVKKQSDLGVFRIAPASFSIGGAEISAEKNLVEYKIDKQVINADKVMNASNGTAIDLLKNSPSVTVDNDDNVTLRGNGTFILLIDGKPTALDIKTALKQIPSSQVENIEIITNPSARYSAEGASGIINVIRKKNRNESVGALLNVRAGLRNKYGADASLGINRKKWSLNTSLNWADEHYYPKTRLFREFYYADSTNQVDAPAERPRNNGNLTGRIGFDFNPSAHDSWGLEAEAGNNIYIDNINSDYTLTDAEGTGKYLSSLYKMDVYGNFATASLNWKHVFDTSTHNLTVLLSGVQWDGRTIISNHVFNANPDFSETNQITGMISHEKNFMRDLNGKIDYTDLWKNGIRLEAGLSYYFRPFSGDLSVSQLDPNSGEWSNDASETTEEIFNQENLSGYLTIGGKLKEVEWQAGLRGENYSRLFELSTLTEKYTLKGLYGYPSFSLLKTLPKNRQLQLSYSRRVQYPGDWNITPTTVYNDGMLYQKGNPTLRPEFIGLVEINFTTPVKKNSFSASLYNRRHHDAIARVVAGENGVIYYLFDNVPQVFYTGTEIGYNWILSKKFSMNISLNAFRKESAGEVLGYTTNFVDYAWSSRVMLNYKPFTNTRIQINSMYDGPARDVQGVRESSLLLGLSLRQDFMNRRLTASLNVRNVFGGYMSHYTVNESNFRSDLYFYPEYPVMFFGLSYKINNYKVRQSQNNAAGRVPGA